MPGVAVAVMVSPAAQVSAGGGIPNGLLDGLVAYWPGDEASGDLLDAHIYGRDGIDVNTVTSAAGKVYSTARQHAKANDEYFGVIGDSAFNADADWSFATWTYHDAISNQTLCQSTGNAGLLFQVHLDTYSANKLTFILFTSVGGYKEAHATTYGNVPTGTWIATVVTYAAITREMTISVNAGSRDTATLGAAPRVSVSSLEMALGYSPGRGLDGRMGPTAYWSRVLSVDDEALWYNDGAGMPYALLDYTTPQMTDIFIVAGQSNASGRGTNSQVWSHASLIPLVYANNYRWKLLADPTDSVDGQVDAVSNEDPTPVGGSVWPLLATQIMAATGRRVAFVPCAKGGSAITAWQPGANHNDRTTLYGSMNYRISQARVLLRAQVRGVLWWQGEQDALADMNAATYNGYLDTIANALATDQGVPLIPCKLQNCSGLTAGQMAEINTGIGAAWADNSNVVAGPDLSGIATDDTFHLQSDVKLLSAATLWYNAIVAGVTL